MDHYWSLNIQNDIELQQHVESAHCQKFQIQYTAQTQDEREIIPYWLRFNKCLREINFFNLTFLFIINGWQLIESLSMVDAPNLQYVKLLYCTVSSFKLICRLYTKNLKEILLHDLNNYMLQYNHISRAYISEKIQLHNFCGASTHIKGHITYKTTTSLLRYNSNSTVSTIKSQNIDKNQNKFHDIYEGNKKIDNLHERTVVKLCQNVNNKWFGIGYQ